MEQKQDSKKRRLVTAFASIWNSPRKAAGQRLNPSRREHPTQGLAWIHASKSWFTQAVMLASNQC